LSNYDAGGNAGTLQDMRKKIRIYFQHSLLLIALVLSLNPAGRAQSKSIADLQPTVILISIDGFRADYLQKFQPANLMSLAQAGVRAQAMTPSFPSKTFPNHYTLVTGLYPQDHGIIENNIYDRETRAVFSLGNREEVQSSRWWLGEPIWVTAEKQGQKTAPLFFPGSEAEIKGKRPTYWKPYDGKLSNEARVDTLLSWLDLPRGERPTFLTLYFSDVDDAGHASGPDSDEVKNAVAKVDRDLGYLIAGLKTRGIFDQVNLIIVSDHGMATVDSNHAIILDEIIDVNQTEKILWTSELVSIFPREGKEDELYRTLKAKLPPQARVYRKADIPARFHYSKSPRIAPLVVMPAEGWILIERQRFEGIRARGDLKKLKGGHGYDNRLPSMRAIFIAHGPAFKKGLVIKPFDNIHVYNVMAKILGLPPAPNDGDDRLARRVLSKRK
jgi:predicted AlkP superfamily pyrophosphatase or phosphodiesterase